MAIILISKGSYTRGAQVAEAVAERLGYACLAREVVLDAAEQLAIPEARLVHAIDDAVSLLDRVTGARQRYVAHMRAALLARFVEDDVVYHGLAAQAFVERVSHVLKVRVLAAEDDRIDIVAARDGVSRAEARRILRRDDRERRRWSQQLYGIDAADPARYDVVLKVGRLSVDQAAELVCAAATSSRFYTTPESQQRVENLALAAAVQAQLSAVTADLEVTARAGHVVLHTAPQVAAARAAAGYLFQRARAVPGVITVHVAARSAAG